MSFCPGLCPGVLYMEGFIRGGFCPFPSVRYTRYDRKFNITFNFRCHMYDKKSVMSHAFDPPLSQTVKPYRGLSPSSVAYFMDGPFGCSPSSVSVVYLHMSTTMMMMMTMMITLCCLWVMYMTNMLHGSWIQNVRRHMHPIVLKQRLTVSSLYLYCDKMV